MPWNLELAWVLESGPKGTTDLWCGTIPGGLFYSPDNGESWQLVESLWNEPGRAQWFGGGYDLPGIHSICVHPQNQDDIVVGVSCGGVWQSRDRGKSWKTICEGLHANYMPPERKHDPLIQDPHCIAQCESNPQVLWMQHHNGIFRSKNRGENWQERPASSSSFGFAVSAHPTNEKEAWFVPAVSDESRVAINGQLRVHHTIDGGQSYDVQTEGLPQKDCYDLVYRHALAVDTSGKTLAFGSTTGSLWISEDGGDSWSQISSNLPPIVAARFI